MKKYRLICEYPGSLKLGTLVSKSVSGKFYNFNGGSYKDELTIHQVENFSDYWQEVIEKDYEILSFKSPYGNIPCPGNNPLFLSESSVKQGYVIHSVKRLSDGEIFTVGDKVIFIAEKPYLNHTSTIKSFNIEYNTICVSNPGCLISTLKNIKCVKKPLFTTEDGVDIFEGDSYWKVSANFKKSSVHSAKKTFRGNAINCTSKYFKNMLNADQYILMNKPCLSINELCTLPGLNMTNFREKLGKLVKSKL